MHLSPSTTQDRLVEARKRLLESGDVPAELVSEVVARSWQRSQEAGLSPMELMGGPPLVNASTLKAALEQESEFLSHARPVMEFVYDQMRDSGSMVVLANAQGLLLHSLGDPEFLTRAERVSLRPGALWKEELRGTNAIGTALIEGRPVVVHGAEHYLERNGFLTCSAAPVRAPDGRLCGVIDISGDQRGYHPHTSALVRSASRMIEDKLFHARHTRDLLLRLHPRAEGLGAVGEGLIALSEDGWIMGANAIAQEWLGLCNTQIGSITLDRVLGPHALRLQNLPGNGQATRITTMRGDALFVRDDPDRRRRVWASGAAPRPRANPNASMPLRTLVRRSHGVDARVHLASQRALKVQAQGIPLLIQGESGTGKEVFARTLHKQGARKDQPFVAVNCAALPEGLIESELFGYVGGAFTGARREGSPGQIRMADGGTLFLDEIGDMPLSLQARLLRVLQDKAVVPVGGTHPIPVDFVLVCATHHQLKEAVAQGRFREDLYWRIAGLTVQMPSLRERDDLIPLISDMLHTLGHEMKHGRVPDMADEVVEALMQHPWPGNLRQLHAVLRTACALLSPHENLLHWEHFGEDLWDDVFSKPYRDDEPPLVAEVAAPRQTLALQTHDEAQPETNLKRLSHTAIERAIRASQGNMSQAARRLGISRNTLYRRLKQLRDAEDDA